MQATNKKLTSEQKAFVREFLIDLNGTEAAIRSGIHAEEARAAGPTHGQPNPHVKKHDHGRRFGPARSCVHCSGHGGEGRICSSAPSAC